MYTWWHWQTGAVSEGGNVRRSVIALMWFSTEPVLSKVSFLRFWPFPPHSTCLFSFVSLHPWWQLIPPTVFFPPYPLYIFFASRSWCNDVPFPAFFIFFHWLASHFSAVISVHSALSSSLPSLLPFPSMSFPFPSHCLLFASLCLHALLDMLMLIIISPLFYSLTSVPFLPPLPPCLPSLPSPLLPALVDWAGDLCHDLCGSSARLWAHRDHKQLPHSDKVMDHKIKNSWHWLSRSMFSFTAGGVLLTLRWPAEQ